MLFSLKKIHSQACRIVRGCLVEHCAKSSVQSQGPAVALWVLGLFQAWREEGLLRYVPSCLSCVLPVAGKLNCHFIVAVFHTSDLTELWRDCQTWSSREFSEIDMKSKDMFFLPRHNLLICLSQYNFHSLTLNLSLFYLNYLLVS